MPTVLPNMFQFHVGTIKSWHLGSGPQQPQRSFNSTLVRLKAVLATDAKEVNKLFQFHVGTIKRYWNVSIKESKACFNSTLVRLKVLFFCLRSKRRYVSIPRWYD